MNRTFEVNKEITLFGKHKVYLWQISQYHGIARRNYPYHYHNYYELSLAVHGKTLFMVNGKSFTCEPGQAALVAPNCLHSAMIDSLEESDFVWTFRFQMDPNSSFAQQTNMCTYIISLNNKTEFLNSLLCQWADLEQKSAYASEYVYPCALLLLQMIFEELEHNAVAYEDRSDPQYRYVLQYIMKNYLNGFSLDDLANHFFISKSHFMRCFKQNFGISPIHYRNELLINASCVYLVDTNMNTRNISDLLGFNNPTVFLRSFKNFMNMKPSEYRKYFRENKEIQDELRLSDPQEHLNFMCPLP